MNNLAVLPAPTEQTMTSREIAELTLSTHDSVMKSIRRYIEQGVVSPTETPYVHAQNGQTYMEFHLGFRDAMFIASGYSANLRARIIDRWIQLEKPLVPLFSVPTTLSGALRLAAEQAETIEQQAAQIATAAPAVEFVGRYVDSTGSKGFRQVCKLLKAKEPEFRMFLTEAKVMYRLGGEWAPFADHIAAGRFDVKAGTAEVSGHAFNSARFTPKGVQWVAGEFAKWRLRQQEEAEHARARRGEALPIVPASAPLPSHSALIVDGNTLRIHLPVPYKKD